MNIAVNVATGKTVILNSYHSTLNCIYLKKIKVRSRAAVGSAVLVTVADHHDNDMHEPNL